MPKLWMTSCHHGARTPQGFQGRHATLGEAQPEPCEPAVNSVTSCQRAPEMHLIPVTTKLVLTLNFCFGIQKVQKPTGPVLFTSMELW